ncbi:MAG: formate dehydrogenase subunit delta [Curvibacter sp.]|nr:formate dehydrogenase subunit delta [Curvibacter sp.]
MSTHSDNLIQMANRIGQFFESMPDHAEALEGVAQHIRKFWEPRMRAEFLRLVDAPGEREVRAIVLEAVGVYRGVLEEGL